MWIIIIITLLLVSIGISYAYFNVVNNEQNTAIVTVIGKTACIDISLSESNNNILTYNYPVNDGFALNNIKPIEINVTNRCQEVQEGIKYSLIFSTLANNNEKPIKDYQIKTKVINKKGNEEKVIKEPTILNKINKIKEGNVYELLNKTYNENEITNKYDVKNSYVLDVNEVASNSTVTYKVYLWIDYYEGNPYPNVELNNFNNSTKNKEFRGIFSVLTNIEESGESFQEEVTEFVYTGDREDYQTFIPSRDGEYLIELWGASGGDYYSYKGGKGAYTNGIISLKKGEALYVYVGEAGSESAAEKFNCGGSIAGVWGATGGGATDIRLTPGKWNAFESLKSRIMVSAGGGGANDRNHGDDKDLYWYGAGNGGYGGGLIGGDGESPSDTHTNPTTGITYGWAIAYGATQTDGGSWFWNYSDSGDYGVNAGKNGQFGYSLFGQSSGGGGYYGGASVAHGGGSGGSSFVSGYEGCNAIEASSTEGNITHTGESIHYSNKVFLYPGMIAGNALMPTYDGTKTMLGNTGHGHAKITYLG